MGWLRLPLLSYVRTLLLLEDCLIEIVRGCQRGDNRCQRKLYESFFRYGFAIVRRFVTCDDDSREVLNDAFVKVFSKVHLFNLSQEFKPWFRTIVVNTAIDFFRSSCNRKMMELSAEPSIAIPDSSNVLDSLGAKDIIQLLDLLPDMHRFVFVLFEIEGYSHAEIAKRLKVKESTSRGNLTRAKQQLQLLVAKHYSYERK